MVLPFILLIIYLPEGKVKAMVCHIWMCHIWFVIYGVVIYGCESWTIKKAECWRIDAFELWCWRRLLRVPWTARRSNQSILRNQSWVFIGRTDAEAETPVLWPPHAKSWFIRKDPVAGKDWRQEEKRMTEDETVGWHHRHDRHEFEQASGVGDGQGGLVCCSPWGHKESDTTEWLNWTEGKVLFSRVQVVESSENETDTLATASS